MLPASPMYLLPACAYSVRHRALYSNSEQMCSSSSFGRVKCRPSVSGVPTLELKPQGKGFHLHAHTVLLHRLKYPCGSGIHIPVLVGWHTWVTYSCTNRPVLIDLYWSFLHLLYLHVCVSSIALLIESLHISWTIFYARKLLEWNSNLVFALQ